jgi:hypothetical protein
LQNLFSIVDQLVYRRLSRSRKGQGRIDPLHTSKDFRISGARSVGARVISHPFQMKRVVVVSAIELRANDGGEHLGIGANQCDFLF